MNKCCNHTRIFIAGRMGGPPISQKFAHSLSPPRKIPPSRLSLTKFLQPPLYNDFHVIISPPPKKNKQKLSCSHCFCNIFILTSYLMLLLPNSYWKCITYHFIPTTSIKMPNFTLNAMEGTQP